MLARGKLVIYGKELIEDRFVVLKRFGFFKQVVPPISGATYFGDALRIAGSDHFSIAKPENAQAIQNRLLCQFIATIARTGFALNNVSEGNGELRTVVNGCEICVVSGRIEDYPINKETVFALPCNEYFDDRCIDDGRSTLGAYVHRHYGERSSSFAALIQAQCKRKFGDGADQQKTADETAKSFGVGRCILISAPFGESPPVALVSTTTQRSGQGLASRISYLFDGMRELFTLLADARLNQVVMPVMGAGHGGINSSLALVGLVLALAEAARYGPEQHRRKKVTIVVFRRSPTEPAEVAPDVIRRALALIANRD
ncbi:macro domain-containing protein [Mesorhizobium sp. IMUNJ 23232]|uniref:macro domain-containing protein n=1 Tax=Mesorhizobium sp. IMUNJ 23232 TaxID=3376064 RepID=UPI0037B544A5